MITKPGMFPSYRAMITTLLEWAITAAICWALVYQYARGIDRGL